MSHRARNAQKLQKLYDYLKNNEAYLVNYEEREQQNKPYTSQVAETHIDSIINERYKKRVRKCNGLVKEPIMYYKLEEITCNEWTRIGSHSVLSHQ